MAIFGDKYKMQASNRYHDLSGFLAEKFPFKVQKISINAGFTCPNRDGTVGYGGCTYCNNQTFNPEYCMTEKSVTQQLEEGKRFFARKYPNMKYLAYFQAYTNTYGKLDELVRMYEEALSVDDVVGMVIGTRPDCMPDELLDYLAKLNKRIFLSVEYGVESTCNETLKRINRGHDYQTAVKAIQRTAEKGIPVGIHLILGLPGESREQILDEADEVSKLPVISLKLHQLQLIRGTRMAKEYAEHPEQFHLYSADEYVELVVDFLERLRPDMVVDRFVSQSPKSLLIAPDWGLKNFEFTEKVKQCLLRRDTFQGRLFKVSSY
jgi:radical SAM protein (TIGR01212 family)